MDVDESLLNQKLSLIDLPICIFEFVNAMSSYILCGVCLSSISPARAEIESIFGFCFEERESSYQADLYDIFGALK